MYIFVNVERHRNVMGEIVQSLVSEYGVPVSIVDNIQKICPKCTSASVSDDSMKSEETTEHDHKCSAKHHRHNNNEEVMKTTSAPAASINTSSSSRSSCASITILSPPPPPTVTQLQPPAAKKSRVETVDDVLEAMAKDVKIIRAPSPPPSFLESQEMLQKAIAQAFQNGTHRDFEKEFGSCSKSMAISDDVSNSSNMDLDDDEYSNVCINPQLLANFISSTPNIFASSSDLLKSNKPSTSPSTSNSANNKRDIPPNLTVNGKTRRGRIVYTQQELNILEQYYLDDPNACADLAKRDELCKILDIDYHRLKVWFQNRRRKDKIRTQVEEDPCGGLGFLNPMLRESSSSPQVHIKTE